MNDAHFSDIEEFDASEALSKTWLDIELEEKLAEIEALEKKIDRLSEQRDYWADKYFKISLASY